MCITEFGIADFLEFLDLIREWYRVDGRYSLDGGRGQAWVVVVTVTGSLANSVHNNLSSLSDGSLCTIIPLSVSAGRNSSRYGAHWPRAAVHAVEI